MLHDPYSANDNVNDLETVRLALRGAVATVHSLQNLNGEFKTQLQTFAQKESAAQQRIADLEMRLAQLQARWEGAQKEQFADRRRMEEQLRSQIAATEAQRWRGKLEEQRHTMQEIEKSRQQRDLELGHMRQMLAERDSELSKVQSQKIQLEQKAGEEWTALLSKVRTDLRTAVEQAVSDKEQEFNALREKWTQKSDALHTQLKKSEEERVRMEHALGEAYTQRREELETLWRHREQQFWTDLSQKRAALELSLEERLTERLTILSAEYEERKRNLEAALHTREALVRATFETKEKELTERIAAERLALEEQSREEREKIETERHALRDLFKNEDQRLSQKALTLDLDRRRNWDGQERSLRQAIEQQLRETFHHEHDEFRQRMAQMTAEFETQKAGLEARAKELLKRIASMQAEFISRTEEAVRLRQELDLTREQFRRLSGEFIRQKQERIAEAEERENDYRGKLAEAEGRYKAREEAVLSEQLKVQQRQEASQQEFGKELTTTAERLIQEKQAQWERLNGILENERRLLHQRLVEKEQLHCAERLKLQTKVEALSDRLAEAERSLARKEGSAGQ